MSLVSHAVKKQVYVKLTSDSNILSGHTISLLSGSAVVQQALTNDSGCAAFGVGYGHYVVRLEKGTFEQQQVQLSATDKTDHTIQMNNLDPIMSTVSIQVNLDGQLYKDQISVLVSSNAVLISQGVFNYKAVMNGL